MILRSALVLIVTLSLLIGCGINSVTKAEIEAIVKATSKANQA